MMASNDNVVLVIIMTAMTDCAAQFVVSVCLYVVSMLRVRGQLGAPVRPDDRPSALMFPSSDSVTEGEAPAAVNAAYLQTVLKKLRSDTSPVMWRPPGTLESSSSRHQRCSPPPRARRYE